MSDKGKDELLEKAYGAIVLHLSDKVLRKVARGETIAG